MSHSYIIPFTLNPPIKTYPGYAFVLSMLFADSNKFFPWLLNHYIIPIGNEHGTRYEFMPTDPFYVSEGVMQYVSTDISIDLLDDNRIFYDYVVAMLHQGYGLVCWMNERYITNRRAYQRYDYIHDNMIVGYNKNELTFTLVGYSSVGRYEATTVHKDQVIMSLRNSKKPSAALNFIKPNPAFFPTFKLCCVCKQLQDYLDAPQIGELGHSSFYGISNWVTGISATQKLACYPIDRAKKYDIRLYSFLQDRTWLMYERTKYMSDKGYISFDSGIKEKMLEIHKMAKTAQFMAMKYNVSSQEQLPYSIRETINAVVHLENDILRKCII